MITAKQIHDLYEQDTFQWFNENAKFLREKKFELLDIDQLAEEIESMGKAEMYELESFLKILFLHLLKWKYQKDYQGKSGWLLSIKEHRKRANKQISKNPSLKSYLQEIVLDAYGLARAMAVTETGLEPDIFPEEMPFTLKEALTEEWLPS